MSKRKKQDVSNLGTRDTFSSRWGFVLACVGSAVGMGNIWLFPYRVGQFGGFAFLVPYFICIFLLGFTGVIEEMTFGRAMKTGPLGAFKKAMEKRGKKNGDVIGLIPVIGSLAIAIGYSVVVGWIIKFLFGAFVGDLVKTTDSTAYFGEIAGTFGSVPWHLIALALTFIIMSVGISKGIEKVNKILMPAFFVLFIILAIRVPFLDGASKGYEFLFTSDWSKLLSPKTWIYALGQSFFSLSLAGSGTVVYGSYLKDSENVVKASRSIAIFDTLAASLAALVIIPSVFAFGMKPTAGPPMLFITMPEVFKKMPLGQMFSIIFFIAVLFAGITSLINLFETPIEALQDKFKLSRKKSVSIIAIIGVVVGLLIENVEVMGKWMDVVSIYVIPLGALLAAIMFFWVCGDKFVKDEIGKGLDGEVPKFIIPLGKYVFCGLTILVLILGILWGGIG
ncbi:sodium-dependent transporter [Miniphocaeibacter massiliensis]|uniref:sodium-dependent transporter n=1 Tax=Miniphocaeibacter massiliensis TaxID=2041841 RepID=UPI000C1BC841|nr:sodium-dependent transporter [Miniphocaeibacter massiliensis]